MRQYLMPCRYVAEEDPVYTDLLKELQARDGEGAQAAMDEEEGLVMDNTQQQLATNAKCPLSGKPVRAAAPGPSLEVFPGVCSCLRSAFTAYQKPP